MSAIRRIATLQAQLREVGRIRMGWQQPDPKSRTGFRPARLDTFRLTSRDETAVMAAADVYGGRVSEWEEAPEATGRQWQVIIESPYLDVLVPPNGYESTFELWSAGGCQRRCNGQFDEITRGPCLCPADPEERTALAKEGQACKPTSRLRVLLPRLRSIGAWRLESHGYFAAVELSGMADFLLAAAQRGYAYPARLRIEKRKVKRPGEPEHDFIVPVLELPDLTPQEVLGSGTPVRQIGPGDPDLPKAIIDLAAAPVASAAAESLTGAATVSAPTSGQDDGPASPVPMTITELQCRAASATIGISDLNAKSRELFGKNINLLANEQRQAVAEEMGLA